MGFQNFRFDVDDGGQRLRRGEVGDRSDCFTIEVVPGIE